MAELVAELGCCVAGSVRHFQGNPGEMGWSCGYKNMQMQISHLLERDKVNTLLHSYAFTSLAVCFAFQAAVTRTGSVPVKSGTPSISRESWHNCADRSVLCRRWWMPCLAGAAMCQTSHHCRPGWSAPGQQGSTQQAPSSLAGVKSDPSTCSTEQHRGKCVSKILDDAMLA